MGAGVGEVLTFAVGVAISPVPIIAVVLMLLSARAHVNGPLFLLGWALALAVVGAAAYVLVSAAEVDTSESASDTVSWGTLLLGVVLVAMAVRLWRARPPHGTVPELPTWMAGTDRLSPARALGIGVLLAGANPKNLILTVGAAAGLAQLGLPTGDAVASLAVFVVIASLTVAGPILYALSGGEAARIRLDELRTWLGLNNAVLMAVLLLVIGVGMVAKALPQLTA